MANDHIQLRGLWPLICGNPFLYLNALRGKKNAVSVYPAGREPMARSKHDFAKFIVRQGASAPATIARIADGKLTESIFGTDQTLSQFLENLPSGCYFCKPDEGFYGLGAMRLEISSGSVKINGRDGNRDALLTLLASYPYLIQEFLTPLQHPGIARFNPAVVNTLRLVTFDVDGGPAVVAAFMRSATVSRAVDNWHSGGIGVPIDLEAGVLGRHGVLKDGLKLIETHPVSGLAFADQPIPFLQEAVMLVKNLQAKLRMRSGGWDIAVLEHGPAVIECNELWDLYFTAQLNPEFTGKFLAFHVPEHQGVFRVTFSGDFPDREDVRLFLCNILGKSLASGRLDRLSREEVVVTIAGSHAALADVQTELKAAPFRARLRKVKGRRSTADIRPGLDISASFGAAVDEIYGPEKPLSKRI